MFLFSCTLGSTLSFITRIFQLDLDFLCGSYGFLGIFGQIQHSRIDRKPRVVVVDVGGVVQWSTPLCVIAVVALR